VIVSTHTDKEMKMQETKKTVYVDMDNVLVDFKTGIDRLPESVIQQYQGKLDDVPGIFGLMEPMPGALEAIEALSKHFELYILTTAPWKNPSAWTDKAQWVQKYFGAEECSVFHKRLIITHRKDLNTGDFLIDDREKNGAGEFRGELILFGSEKFPNWEKVSEYLLSQVHVYDCRVTEEKNKEEIQKNKSESSPTEKPKKFTPEEREARQEDLVEKFRQAAKRASQRLKQWISEDDVQNNQCIDLINHPLAMSHLLWMRDNDPGGLRSSHRRGILKKQVETLVSQAFQFEEKLKAKGLPEDAVEEYVLDFVAPAEDMGDLPEKPSMSQKEFDQIVNSLLD